MFLLVLKMMFVQKNLFCTRPEKMLKWRRNFLIILCCEFELKNIIIDFMPIFFFLSFGITIMHIAHSFTV